MFNFFIENFIKSIEFHTGRLLYQSAYIQHQIYKVFDEGYQVTGVFLDISMALDTVFHEGLLFKLKQNAILGNLLSILINFLRDRK